MDDLVQWLRAQLDEDERIARAVEDRGAPWGGQWMADGNSAVRTLNGHVLVYRHGEHPLKPGLVDHVVAHDPARVLREIDAKRKILDTLHEEGGDRMFADIFRLLALPFADRPGYLEEWRP